MGKPVPENDSADGSSLHRVLAEYIRRRESGEAVDIELFCAAHPELADGLRSYAVGEGLLNAMTNPASVDSDQVRSAETIRPGAAERTGFTPQAEFGRYRLLRELGNGAMGAVYLAEDAVLGRQVAVKIPKATGTEGTEFLKRFTREAQAAARLDHPNVCRVYDAGNVNGVPFISMEFIDGPRLSQCVGLTDYRNERRVAELVIGIASGLQYAHDRGIVHRDVKTSNVMLKGGDVPCVTDFGLARIEEVQESKLTHHGSILGTPAYMAPEQIKADQELLGPRSDVYALGVVLYELLVGHTPFQGATLVILNQALHDLPRPPQQCRPGLDSKLSDFCLRMLEKKPERRPQSMQEVIDFLQSWLKETSPESQAQRAKIAAERAKYEAMKTEVLGLVQRGRYAQATAALEQMLRLTAPEATTYIEWARQTIAQVRQLPKRLKKAVPALLDTAKQCLRVHDYAQAVQLLQDIPLEFRGPEVQRTLDQSLELQEESDLLLLSLQETVRTRQLDGIEDNLHRYLQLKPGSKFAKDLQKTLLSYRQVPLKQRRYQFDGKGHLQPYSSSHLADNRLLIAAACFALVFGLAYAGFMISLKDGSRTLTVEIDEDWLRKQGGSVTLSVDGREHTISGPGVEVTVAFGEHGFSVKSGNTVVHNPETLSVEKDGGRILWIDATRMAIVNAKQSVPPIPSPEPATDQQRLLELVIALHKYHEEFKQFPSTESPSGVGNVRVGWRLKLLPWLGYADAYASVNLKLPWNDQANSGRLSFLPDALHSESLTAQQREQWLTPFVAPVGDKTVLGGTTGVRLPEITDGTVDTILLLVVPATNAVAWASPNELTIDMNDPLRDIGTFPGGMVTVAMCDGSLQEIPTSIGAEQWRRLLQYNDGNPVDWELIRTARESADKAKPPIRTAPFTAEEARQLQTEWASHLGVPVEWTNSIGVRFRLIPPGRFLMNAASKHYGEVASPLYMAKTELTAGEYAAGTGATIPAAAADVPRGMVTVIEAMEFCNLLSQKEALSAAYDSRSGNYRPRAADGYRLVSTVEGEYAALGGRDVTWQPTPAEWDAIAWYGANSDGKIHAVALKNASPFGVHDLYGNVWEWDSEAGQFRGLHFGQPAGKMAVCGERFSNGTKYRAPDVGFRLALPITPAVITHVRRPPPAAPDERQSPAVEPTAPVETTGFTALQSRCAETQRKAAEKLGLPVVETGVSGVSLRLIAPLHPTQPPPFYLAEVEVTQELYSRLVGTNPSTFQGRSPREQKRFEQHPVENVTFVEAARFCNRLSVAEGLDVMYAITPTSITLKKGNGYRLPTKDEFGVAVMPGKAWEPFPVGDFAVYRDNSGGTTKPVKSRKPYFWGLSDTRGNVAEFLWHPVAEIDAMSQRTKSLETGGGCFTEQESDLHGWTVSDWWNRRRRTDGFRIARNAVSRPSESK